MTIRALIFDFDGLLVDTESLHFQTWTEMFARYGVPFRLERWLLDLGTHGMFDPIAELEELTGRRVDREAVLRERQLQHHSLCEREALRPGVLALLDAARAAGLRLAVASSSDHTWVDRWLTHHGIREYFSCVQCRDDVAHVKPAPDLFLSAAECLGVVPGECVVLEDSPNGMRAAAAAGMRCVAVPTALTAAVELPEVTLRLQSLDELPLDELLRRLDTVPMRPLAK